MISMPKIHFFFLNLGHFLTHLFMLLFASTAALQLTQTWNMSYAELIVYGTPALMVLGLAALPSGWLGDKWSRCGMMFLFFSGTGIAGLATSATNSPIQMAIGLFFIGLFASIYHPVGLSMVANASKKGRAFAINGVYGNLGVAAAPLLAAAMIYLENWRLIFAVPGGIALIVGGVYALFWLRGHFSQLEQPIVTSKPLSSTDDPASFNDSLKKGITTNTLNIPVQRVFSSTLMIVFCITMLGGLIFQSSTFSLPKFFSEEIPNNDLAGAIQLGQIGGWSFMVLAIASLAQLVTGEWADKRSLRAALLVVIGLQAPLFLLTAMVGGKIVVLVAFGFMMLIFSQVPLNDALVAKASIPAWRGRIYAIKHLVGFTVSSASIPMVALFHSNTGFSGLFLFLALLAAIIFMIANLLPRSVAAIAAE